MFRIALKTGDWLNKREAASCSSIIFSEVSFAKDAVALRCDATQGSMSIKFTKSKHLEFSYYGIGTFIL